MKLTPDQINQLSAVIEEVVDSAELQDAELRKVAHTDMLRLATNIIESGFMTFESIMARCEEAAEGTKLERMAGQEMEQDIRRIAVRRGLMEE